MYDRVMATMVRKQLYITQEQERRLKAAARREGRTEAGVVRELLEQLPEARVKATDETEIMRRLREKGLLPPAKPPLSNEEYEALRHKLEAWAKTHPNPRLAEAVIEMREESPY
jgi:predicted DNA-binding protein